MKNILIVDDNKNNRMLLNVLLDDYAEDHPGVAFETVEAENGKEAVERASEKDFDLILMDIMMPEMDGIEATRRIRKDNKDVMILAVSAVDDEVRKKEILSCGAEDYISKPVNADVFQSRLGNYLALIDSRSHKTFNAEAFNLYTREVFNRQMIFMIRSEDALSEFWEYYLLNETLKCDGLSDVVRTLSSLGELFVKLGLETRIVVEESEEKLYMSLDSIDELDSRLIKLVMAKNMAVKEYKTDRTRISFMLEKLPEELPAYETAAVEAEPETAAAEISVDFIKTSDRQLRVFDYMEPEDLMEIEDYIKQLDSLFLVVGSGDLSDDEIMDIYTYIERIGKMMTIYPESFRSGQALVDLAGDIATHTGEFKSRSTALAPMCAAFNSDLSSWLRLTFREGIASVDYMDDTIIANAQTISSMLKMDESATDEADLDDIFDF